MREPISDLNRVGKGIYWAALAFAVVHALLYVVAVPTWDLFDEEAHLSYALYLIDDFDIPYVDDPVQQRILESAVATDRWSTLRIGRPVAPELNEFGLEGRSYEGYHPPLYYAAVSPLTLISSSDAWWELYASRLLGLFLIFWFAIISWAYARDWMTDGNGLIWGTAVVVVASVPSVAASAGRVSNDLMVGFFLAAGTLMASRLLEERRTDQALYVGLLTAAAILTKGQGAVLLLVTVATCLLLLWRKQLTTQLLVRSLGPGVLAFAIWTLWTWLRYDTTNGAEAYLDYAGAINPVGFTGFLEDVWLNSWSSYWGAYDGGSLRWLTGVVVLVVAIAGLTGVLAGSASWLRTAEGRQRLILTATLVVGLLASAWVANDSGLAHPHGRMFIGAIPALVAVTIAGVRHLAGDIAAVQIGAVSVALSAGFFLFWFLPFFY